MPSVLIELVRVFSRGQGKHLSVIMEDFYSSWEKLSLFEKENTGFVLPNIPKRNEFIIAAKFLTTRALNTEAVGRTFKQVWRCSDGFKIRNLDDHKVLFMFDDERDVNRILLNQPWSFDKHLVVVQKYNRGIQLNSLTFDTAMFWVEVHNFPIQLCARRWLKKFVKTLVRWFVLLGLKQRKGAASFGYESRWIFLYHCVKEG